eukprot:scaffold462500_cov46-Prasinocladus_malaysianus.AAC.1
MAELEHMLAECEAAGVALLDGTMFTHHPRLGAMKKEIDKLGGAMEVSSHINSNATARPPS